MIDQILRISLQLPGLSKDIRDERFVFCAHLVFSSLEFGLVDQLGQGMLLKHGKFLQTFLVIFGDLGAELLLGLDQGLLGKVFAKFSQVATEFVLELLMQSLKVSQPAS